MKGVAKPVALVTGSAKRLGREMALTLGGEGYFVWVHYLSSEKEAAKVLAEIKKVGGDGALVQGDIGLPSDIDKIVAQVKKTSKKIDVLVNNVGIYRTGNLHTFSVHDFSEILGSNLTGPFYLMQKCEPLFPKKGGSIINIGYAGIENLTASNHNTAYLISKSGLFILTKSFAQAFGSKNIRVNMVSPGILDNSVELPKKPAAQVPLGTLGTCRDICNALIFLISDNARYITGVNVDVAGGYMLRLSGLETDGK